MSGCRRNLNIKEPSRLPFFTVISQREAGQGVSSGSRSQRVRESYSSKVLCSACGPWQETALQSASCTNLGKPHHSQKNCHWPEERLTSVDLPEGRWPPWEDDDMKVVKYKKNREQICVDWVYQGLSVCSQGRGNLNQNSGSFSLSVISWELS